MVTTRRKLLTSRRTIVPKLTRRGPPTLAAGPILKWVGGKTRLLSELQSRMPTHFGRYFEPFLGGAALFFRCAPAQAVLADHNADLINVYRCVATDVDKVARKIAAHKRKHCEEYYYQQRNRWNQRSSRQTAIDRAAQFLYLNKTCFNGLWRVNSKGEFNVPIGRYENPQIYNLKSLRAAAIALQNAELYTAHYRDIVASAEAGDFVYFDPPYHPITTTANFTGYTPGNFGDADQIELRNVAENVANRGCAVMLSNSDTPFIRKLFHGWKIDQVLCGRSINSAPGKRGVVAELIISNPC